ncbi:hypothetical protein AB6864_24635 [Serratia proteamaculans]|uniref:hypothetical protein n=1 Tax=Serratia proteamaculans TaxID=28151 RepID=UPI0028E9FD72|nr:hypothetical protein [Serratia proteamaculans]
MMEIFDLENVYDEQISPLMQKIIAICKENNMPMIASFAFENCEERNLGCCTTILNDFDERVVPEFTQSLRIIRKEPQVFSFAITSGEAK